MQHGGRTTAGGDVPWWVWALVVWGVLALALGIVIGRAIRTAERRERAREHADEEDEQRPRAS
jgi:flagellar biosynthesis/type III secretory pathway M-ring protein FliF/YscJ